ncbi:MAG: hypothetical protein C0514_02330 [Candidatus Puniceispirillum sp.]|nr:hypothetical protein [Candidatus Puniceispirillum sp.]
MLSSVSTQEKSTMKSIFYATSLVLSFLTIAPHIQASNSPLDALDVEEGTKTVRPVGLDVALNVGYGNEINIPSTLVQSLNDFVTSCAGKSEMNQFHSPFMWYRPTPEELTRISDLGFASCHLGAALRMRAHLSCENAPLIQRVLRDSSYAKAQFLLPAAMGLSHTQLEEAANIEDVQERLDFLIQAPRPDTWVYGMLGADPLLDHLAIETSIRTRIANNPDLISSFFVRNLKEGTDLTRQRITGFLLQVTGNVSEGKTRAEHLGYSKVSNVVHALQKKKLKRPFGLFREAFPFTDGSAGTDLKNHTPDYLDIMPQWTYTPSTYLKPRRS